MGRLTQHLVDGRSTSSATFTASERRSRLCSGTRPTIVRADTRRSRRVAKLLRECLALEIEIGASVSHCGREGRVARPLADRREVDSDNNRQLPQFTSTMHTTRE